MKCKNCDAETRTIQLDNGHAGCAVCGEIKSLGSGDCFIQEIGSAGEQRPPTTVSEADLSNQADPSSKLHPFDHRSHEIAKGWLSEYPRLANQARRDLLETFAAALMRGYDEGVKAQKQPSTTSDWKPYDIRAIIGRASGSLLFASSLRHAVDEALYYKRHGISPQVIDRATGKDVTDELFPYGIPVPDLMGSGMPVLRSEIGLSFINPTGKPTT